MTWSERRDLKVSLLILCVSRASASEVLVGGDKGWTLGGQYSEIIVQAGDVLVRYDFTPHEGQVEGLTF